MNRTRVLLADDHVILLEALKKLVEPACVVVGTATDGRVLIERAEELRPDVIIADINMPQLNGLDFRWLRISINLGNDSINAFNF